MSNSTLGFQNPTTTNKSLDTEQLNVGGTMVERERVQITGDRSDAITQVLNSTAAPTMWGPVVHSLQDTRLDSLNDGVNTLATAPAYTGDFTFSGGPGVILELKGSSTKTIQVLEIYYTKPSAQAELTISKRSAAAWWSLSHSNQGPPLQRQRRRLSHPDHLHLGPNPRNPYWPDIQ